MSQIQINDRTITVTWDTDAGDELSVDIYWYGGKLKSKSCRDTTTYTAEEQGVYCFVAYKEKDGKKCQNVKK